MRRVLLVLTLVAGLTDALVAARAGRRRRHRKDRQVQREDDSAGGDRELPADPVHREEGKGEADRRAVVAKGLCLSTPVFTLDRSPRKKLNSRGAFTFKKTYVGSKFDTISGRFISPTEVEGFVVYHFNAQDLCGGGKVKVRFTAKRG